MIRHIFLVCLLSLSLSCLSQSSIEDTLNTLNEHSIPYIQTTELEFTASHYFLDTRRQEEFNVSHLKNAIWVGYDNFSLEKVEQKITDKSVPIIVYCSIGVRSEQIGEKLVAAGFTNVKNLYGGIFKWKNEGGTVYDNNNTSTEKIHGYSKFWSKFLTNGEKVY